MNKVFKVIWSEARNAYVVVSEIAKNHGSKSCSTKKLLAMLIATGVMTCASMAPAMAGNPAPDDLNVTIGKGAHVSVWNGVSGQTISGDIAVGQNAHAWNGEYTYKDKYARIGSKEYLLDFGQGGVVGAEWFRYKVADGSKIAGSIAIGKNTLARTGSVMLGDHSYTGKLGDIEINPENPMTYNDGIYSTTLGAGAYNSGSLAAVTGALSIASGKDTKNTGATIYGSMNSIESATSDNIYSGVASSVLGFANRTQNANAALIWGTGNEVTNSVEDIGINTNWNNVSVADAQKKAIEAMQSSKYAGGSVMAIGGGNKADYAKYSQLTGVQNKVTGTEAKAAKYDFVNGYQNTVSNASDVTVIGIKNAVTADGNKVIGDNHNVSGNDNVIFGSADKVTETTVNNAVVLGHNAKVTGEGGVVLGAGSVASTAANALGYGAAEGETGIAWKATNGAVSVGSSVEGKKITRQITNVAAGTEDTDAVNVAQLKKVSEAAASASQGWKLKTQNGNASDVKPGATVEFDGDANIQVGNDGNKVSVTLKKQLTGIQSITGAGEGAGSISFANGGIKFNNKVTIDNNGKISGVANGKISTDSTDAVNGSQLNAVKEAANKGWNLSTGKGKAVNVAPGETVDFSGDDNIVVSNTGNNVVVKLGKELTGLTSVTTNNAYVTNVDASKNESVTNVEYVKNQIADAALSAGDGISITDKKINVKLKEGEQNLVVNQDGLSLNTTLNGMEAINGVGGGKISFSGGNVTINNNVTFNKDGRIQNVTAGTENTDAVNYGQLKDYVAANDTHIKGGSYAVGEVTDNAGNKSQGVSMHIVNKEGNVTGTVTITDVAKASDVGNVTNINNDLKNPNGTTTVVDAVNNLNQKLDKKVGDLNYVEGGAETKGNYVTNGESTTVSIGKLDQALKDVATTAAKHTTVSGSSNIVVEPPTTNTDGGKNYNVKLADEITVNSVTANTFTAGQTVVMNKYGLMVGDKVSVSATAVTAGKTSISDEGVKVDGKTYISADGLNANNNKITNVVDGTVEKDSKDAINGGQLHQAKADINNRIDGVENQVISNSNRIGQLSSRVNKVGAGAAALAALHPMDFDPDDKLTFSAGYGNYGGENAAAIGAYYRPDEKVMFSVGGTVGNGENMVNAGISFALDRTNHVSNSRTALAREVIDLRGQLAEMGAKMAKMEKAFGMLDESKTKLFPDIPANHWAYEYIAKLAGNGILEGYPDGNFGGDRLMTRYEFAAMLYRAIENGAALEEKIIKEFEPELGRIRVDRISGEDGDRDKIERVRVNDTKGERDHYGNKLAK